MPRDLIRPPRAGRRAAVLAAACCGFTGSFFGGFYGSQAAAADETITIQHVTLRDGRALDGIQHGRVFDCYDVATGHLIATIPKVFPEDIVTSEDETINVLPAGATPVAAGDTAPAPAPAASPGAAATGHGLGGKWGTSYKAALASAKRTDRPLLILFTFDDAAGKAFDDDIGQDPGFRTWAKDRLVLLRIDLGKDQLPVLKTQDDELVRVHKVTGHPQIAVCNQDGKEVMRADYHGNGADAWLPGFRKQVDAAMPPPEAPAPVAELPPPAKATAAVVPAPPVVATPVTPTSIPPVAPAPAPVAVAPAPVATQPTTPPVAQTPVAPVPVAPVAQTAVAPTPVAPVAQTAVAPTPVAPPPVAPTPVAAPPVTAQAPAQVAAAPAPSPSPVQPAPPALPVEPLTPLTIERSPAPTVPAALIGTWVPDHRISSTDAHQNLTQFGNDLTLTITPTSATFTVADQVDDGIARPFAILSVTGDTVILRAYLHRAADCLDRVGFTYRDGRIYLPMGKGAGGAAPVLVLIPKP